MATKTGYIPVADILARGETRIGDEYVFGTAGPNTFDCSGLIKWIFQPYGVDLPHHAATQATMGKAVPKNAIQAGDLVFSDWGDGPNSHVGMATDPNHILVAPETGQKVKIEPLSANYHNHITAVRRLPQLAATSTGGEVAGSQPSVGTSTSSGSSPGITVDLTKLAGTTTSGVRSIFESLWSKAGGTIAGDVATAESPFTAIAAPLWGVGDFFEDATLLFKPSNFTRLMAGIGGVICLILGIYFIGRELRT